MHALNNSHNLFRRQDTHYALYSKPRIHRWKNYLKTPFVVSTIRHTKSLMWQAPNRMYVQCEEHKKNEERRNYEHLRSFNEFCVHDFQQQMTSQLQRHYLLDNVQDKVISCIRLLHLNHAPHSSISPFPSMYPSRRDNPPTQTETYHILFVVWIWHPTTSMYYPQSHYHASLTIHTKVNPSDWYWGRSPTYAPLSQFIPCSTNLPPHLRAYGAHGQYMHFTQLPAHHGVDPTTYIISQDIKFISSLKASSNSPTTMDHVNFHPMLNF